MFAFWRMRLRKIWNLLSLQAMGWIAPLLSFFKDDLYIKQAMKFDMTLNKGNKTKP